MKVRMRESRRYVVDYGRKYEPPTVTELIAGMNRMPNGWGVESLEIRDDGTAIVVLQEIHDREVKE